MKVRAIVGGILGILVAALGYFFIEATLLNSLLFGICVFAIYFIVDSFVHTKVGKKLSNAIGTLFTIIIVVVLLIIIVLGLNIYFHLF